MKFEINEEFYIDGKKIKLISGALHYFRIFPEQWEHSLYNLKAMGCNTVETYIPWNVHEPHKNDFNFEGLANVERFIEIAQALDLYIILRPSPYICAEWDFGGLPAWLLKDRNLRVRSQDHKYLRHVEDYFSVLLPKIAKYQFTHGGNVLMMQVENEYGSYGEDHDYLRILVNIMRKYNIDVPLFTSDGGWTEALNSGALSMDGHLATVNFGSDAKTNFAALNSYHKKHGLNFPLMCMEFWDGWFNNWGRDIVRRDYEETAEEVRLVLKQGSINFYMFQGGTNYGFYSGSSDFGATNIAQITSYDYDAPLTEWGEPTEKFYAIQKVIKEEIPETKIMTPKLPSIGKYKSLERNSATSLFSNLKNLEKKYNDYTLPMEDLDQAYGYIVYETKMIGIRNVDKFKVIEADDRAQVYINEKHIASQFQNEIGQNIKFELQEESNIVQILVENMSRNNYGSKIIAPSQNKGIRSGVMEDIHYLAHWNHYNLDFENIDWIDFNQEHDPKTPSFYKFELDIDKPTSTFIDTSQFGKGVVFINGFNLGRYWEIGPTLYLYAPYPVWKKGRNEIIVFETEGVNIKKLKFSDKPIYRNEHLNVY